MHDHSSKPIADADIPDEIRGLRMTRQRKEVYRTLISDRNHPTANDVFMRVKDRLPSISLATVYNCLEVLVQHDVVRQVNFDREPSRYCSNRDDHGHFHDKSSGVIHDVHFKPGVNLADLLDLPAGALIDEIEITLRGQIPQSSN
ncbi:transcriptional repressor [Luteolibacter pohnpeiensis]|uniref:Transcriptional repressor n=1 Tax=Luteolibacter pohnpeiensis TaxID=454153 RepID=A0A934S4Q0_9BACT|nr:Fur family transcriptional regulator [Luteolibacter pohnpeiensis]MBK1883090.1 transcriptional repressor [Luteolibacter pohnpeiensis]